MTDPEEFYDLHPMFNEYPLHELIIHPRIQKEGYRGAPHRDIFADAVRDSKNPLCYNGDIRTVEDYQRMCEEFPTVNRVMIGRGLLSNPMLVEWIREAETAEGVEKQGVAQGSIPEGEALAQNGVRILTQNERARLKNFHDKLYASYRAEIEGDINVLFKMKEFWAYFGAQFPEKEKCLKQIRKAGRLSEYEAAVRGIL